VGGGGRGVGVQTMSGKRTEVNILQAVFRSQPLCGQGCNKRGRNGGGGVLDVPDSCLHVAPWLVIIIYCDTGLYQRRHVHKLIWGGSAFT
jgi:hypothetical protein